MVKGNIINNGYKGVRMMEEKVIIRMLILNIYISVMTTSIVIIHYLSYWIRNKLYYIVVTLLLLTIIWVTTESNMKRIRDLI